MGQRLVEDTALVSFAGKYGTRKEKRMTLLEEYKQKRREIDMKIKELENGNFIRGGNARYVIKAKTKSELLSKLRETIADMQQLLERMEKMEEV